MTWGTKQQNMTSSCRSVCFSLLVWYDHSCLFVKRSWKIHVGCIYITFLDVNVWLHRKSSNGSNCKIYPPCFFFILMFYFAPHCHRQHPQKKERSIQSWSIVKLPNIYGPCFLSAKQLWIYVRNNPHNRTLEIIIPKVVCVLVRSKDSYCSLLPLPTLYFGELENV